jgi:hypothetical protein
VLAHLLSLNAGTQFSRDFDLHPGISVQEYRKRIPVAGYELIRPYVDRVARGEHSALLGRDNRLLMFAVTSGTTSESKLIPVTEQFVRDYRRGWQSWGIGVYDQHPALKQLNIVQISSSHQRFHAADGTPCGNISGLVAAMQKRIVQSMYSVPFQVVNIHDAEAKRYLVLRFAVADPYVGMLITANPSTVLQMAEVLQLRAEDFIRDIHDGTVVGASLSEQDQGRFRRALRPDRRRAQQLQQLIRSDGQLTPAGVWPVMKALGVWTGGSAAAYIPRLQQYFPGVSVRDHGLHASEGRMTMPLQDGTSAGLLEIQTHFFEFIPIAEAESANPTALEAHELEEGQEYLILLTTSSGLYRYNIQDVVRCVGFFGATPLLEFRHKGAHISSITGEKIAESQVVEAVQRACQSTGCSLRLFTMTPEWSEPDLPGYTLYVDSKHGYSEAFTRDSSALQKDILAQAVDRALREINVEYREKRETERLRTIDCIELDSAVWTQFTRFRTSRSGGSLEQYKHPCLLPDPQFQQLFRTACGLRS